MVRSTSTVRMPDSVLIDADPPGSLRDRRHHVDHGADTIIAGDYHCAMTVEEQPQRVIRRRPKNRRAQIAATSAAAFGSLGYHGVSMEDIAARLGISSA